MMVLCCDSQFLHILDNIITELTRLQTSQEHLYSYSLKSLLGSGAA
jgi:hypothetical protein